MWPLRYDHPNREARVLLAGSCEDCETGEGLLDGKDRGPHEGEARRILGAGERANEQRRERYDEKEGTVRVEYKVKPIGSLVRVSSTHCCASTSRLSTS